MAGSIARKNDSSGDTIRKDNARSHRQNYRCRPALEERALSRNQPKPGRPGPRGPSRNPRPPRRRQIGGSNPKHDNRHTEPDSKSRGRPRTGPEATETARRGGRRRQTSRAATTRKDHQATTSARSGHSPNERNGTASEGSTARTKRRCGKHATGGTRRPDKRIETTSAARRHGTTGRQYRGHQRRHHRRKRRRQGTRPLKANQSSHNPKPHAHKADTRAGA